MDASSASEAVSQDRQSVRKGHFDDCGSCCYSGNACQKKVNSTKIVYSSQCFRHEPMRNSDISSEAQPFLSVWTTLGVTVLQQSPQKWNANKFYVLRTHPILRTSIHVIFGYPDLPASENGKPPRSLHTFSISSLVYTGLWQFRSDAIENCHSYLWAGEGIWSSHRPKECHAGQRVRL
jgi:hypothetical protein